MVDYGWLWLIMVDNEKLVFKHGQKGAVCAMIINVSSQVIL